MKFDAVVIGAGPNGLTAAAMLAKAGRKVVVLESADEIGGHTRTLEFAPGFRAPLSDDCGWVPPKVAKAIGLPPLPRQSIARHATYSVDSIDGLFSLPADPRVAADTIARHSRKDGASWAAFATRMHKFANILGALYQLTPPDIDTRSVSEVLLLVAVGRKLRALGRADMIEFLRVMPMSVQDLVDDTFETEVLKTAIAASAIRDLQQGPRSGGTTFNLLHHMVGNPAGSIRTREWLVGGPDAFARSVATIASQAGAQVRTGARVERISVRDGDVTGVVLQGGEEIETPIVISTADPRRTLLNLVDPVWLDPEFLLAVKNIKMRGCTAYALYAFEGEGFEPAFAAPVGLTHSTVGLEKAADAAKYGEISAEPHVEFFVPTFRWPTLAPRAQHVVVARAQYAPYQLKGGWDHDKSCALLDKISARLARTVVGFEEAILHRVLLTPRDVEERFGVTEGALTQGELTLDQILFMRPVPSWGHYAMPIDGLYLGGAGAHPGPGILGGAGYLAARAVLAA